MTDKLKISSFPALSLKWGLKAFDQNTIDDFIKHVDTTSADKLYKECQSICDWYEQVVINRKYFIRKTIEKQLNKSEQEYIIINLAAGSSPLSVDLLKNNHNKIHKIIEVDKDGMEEKQEIYDRYYPELSDKIKCISADITSDSFLVLANEFITEYFGGNPCIIILEGIIYYLKHDEFSKIIQKFHSKHKSNILIVEYLLEDHFISDGTKEIPAKVFQTIKNAFGISSISKYNPDYITNLFSSTGGELIDHKSLKEMEKDRTGSNKYFNHVDEGWIECTAWKL